MGLRYTRIHSAYEITNWFFVRLTSTTRNQRRPTIGRAVMKLWKDAKPKNHGSVLNKNIPYSTKINIHSVGPKMDSQDPKGLTIAVLEQIKYMDGQIPPSSCSRRLWCSRLYGPQTHAG